MKVLDVELDSRPTAAKVAKMAELRIRNLQSFRELQSYNDTGKWLYTHPLIIHMSERFVLEELRQKNPEQFLKEYANCSHNVKRYRSYLKSDARTENRKSDRQNLQRHQDRLTIFENILAEK